MRTNIKQLFHLTGRVAIITGGSVGLGRQMAEGLGEMGANLVLCARKKERCEQAAHELKRLGVETRALACDVKSQDQIQAVVDATVSEFGRIDILINNAGAAWGAPIEEMRLEHWNKVIETNLTGTFLFDWQNHDSSTPRKNHQYRLDRGTPWRRAGISCHRL